MNTSIYTGSAGCGEGTTTSTGLYIKDNSKKNVYKLVHKLLYIQVVSAVCSSGKTHSLIEHIIKNQHLINHLVVLPSMDMVDQVYDDLKKKGVKSVTKITSKTNERKVRVKIRKYLEECREVSEILIITWSGYYDLYDCKNRFYYLNKSEWDIYIDEIPQVDQFFKVDITVNKHLITDFMKLDKDINADISRVKIKKGMKSKLKKAIYSSDDGYKIFKALYRSLSSSNRDVFVNKEKWNEAIKSKKDGEIFFISMLNPKQFRNVTMMGAHIEYSLLYLWFKKYHKFTIKENKNIVKNLRFTEHSKEIGDRVTINYFINGDYSKYFRNTEIDDPNLNSRDIYNNGQMMDYLAIQHYCTVPLFPLVPVSADSNRNKHAYSCL